MFCLAAGVRSLKYASSREKKSQRKSDISTEARKWHIDMYPNSYTHIKTSSVNLIIYWTTKLLFDCFYGF